MASSKRLPEQSVLMALLDYDPATGKLFHKARVAAHFTHAEGARDPEWSASVYNAKYAGKEAFTCVDRDGYRQGRILRRTYQAHRIIWKLVYGVEPDVIDHRNGDTGDNRITNLRNCSVADNSRNYAKLAGGSSRYRGVTWGKRDRRWTAQISAGAAGKRTIGLFKDEVEAARAYDRAARDLHGDFATLNFPDEVAA